MKKKTDRYEYFRSRTVIGQLESAASRLAARRGHTVTLVKDDKYATSLWCTTCDRWACAEVDDGVKIVHGDVVEYDCGDLIQEDIGSFDPDVVWAIYGGANE